MSISYTPWFNALMSDRWDWAQSKVLVHDSVRQSQIYTGDILFLGCMVTCIC